MAVVNLVSRACWENITLTHEHLVGGVSVDAFYGYMLELHLHPVHRPLGLGCTLAKGSWDSPSVALLFGNHGN